MVAPFRMGTTSSTIMQSLGEIEQRAPAGCRCETIMFVCVFVTLRGRRAVRSRGYTLGRFCVAVYESILMPFSASEFSELDR